ncbi:MAG: hypothetical protein LBK82_16480 [Planctomycetaceae bacterium]|jgi:hypothetical protein|nr:hypothetical protein [Planctomycetaceae bacterium]
MNKKVVSFFMSSNIYFILSVTVVLIIVPMCHSEENSKNAISMTFGEKQYELYPFDGKVVQEELNQYFSNIKNNPFYLHLSTVPIIGKSESTKGWRLYRNTPQEHLNDRWSCWGVLWDRSGERSHLIYHPMTLPITAADRPVKNERIAAIISIKYTAEDKKIKESDPIMRSQESKTTTYEVYNNKRTYIAIPIDKTRSNNETIFFCNIDLSVDFAIFNVGVILESNFTEYDNDVRKTLTESTILLEVAIAISEYIRKPFPPKERIEKFVNRYYFDRFESAKKNIMVGEEIKLNIAYTLEATRHPEWIRLRSTSGEFRRDKNDVYYKATEAGKQTLFLEAISGTGANGSPIYDVSLAEQLQIEIDVTESTIAFPSTLEYRHWESLDGRYEIEARLISVDIDDKDGKKYVTLERQDNTRKTKIPLDQISKPDQKYVQEQINKQEN